MQVFASRQATAFNKAVLKLTMLLTKYRHAVKVMKLTAILLLVASLQLTARGLSQTITLSLKDAPIQKVFIEIERQTDFTFFADNQWLKLAKKVTIKVDGLPLMQVLDLCFKNQPFSYSISGKTITLGPKKEKVDTDQKTSISKNLPIDVKGRIVNSRGEPIADATVSVHNTSKRTVTNANGEFSLTGLDEDAVIVISHIQYETASLSLSGNRIVNATLQIKVSSLDELQVIAYGTTTKRLNTGNVTTVKSQDIEKHPVNNPLLTLQGRVPGLFITQTTGLPGSGISVRIQGQNTLETYVGNDPLYIIDGVPFPSRLINTLSRIQGSSGGNTPNEVSGLNGAGSGNPLAYLNPNDIESIDVLKDADATAIYGSRAANGAILITTKKGKAGRTKVTFNIQKGIAKVARKLDLMDTEQYLSMRKEALQNDGLSPNLNSDFDLTFWDQERNTDWQKTLIGNTAEYTDASASISGGNLNTQFFISPGYRNETTVFPGKLGSKSGSVHFSVNNTSNDQKFFSQLTASYMYNTTSLINRDLTVDAINLAPNAPELYNQDGSLNWAQLNNGNATWTNPLAYLNQEYSNKVSNLVSNAVVSYKILSNLEVKSSFGYIDLRTNEFLLNPHSAILPQRRPSTARSASFSNGVSSSWIIEPQIRYTLDISKGKIEFLTGSSFQKRSNYIYNQSGSDYSNDFQLKNINAAPTKSASNGYSIYNYSAVFGRINLNWSDKYILSLNGRRDGSSRFGWENQLHNFYSIAGAWIFSNETIFKSSSSIFSFGKLKASYGTTGNDQIGDYQFFDLYNPIMVGVAIQNSTGYVPFSLPNPYLQWEETKKLNVGLSLGFIKDRILFDINYSKNRSSNQLLSYQLPIISGFTSITRNFPASVQNSGWELSLVSKNISKKNFSWTMNFNVTIPKNELLDFPNLENSSYASTYIIGKPITISKKFVYGGVNDATGVYRFIDTGGNFVSAPKFIDRTFIYNPLPRFYGGITNDISWNGLELSFLFQFVKQDGIDYSYSFTTPGFFGNTSNLGNQPNSLEDRWQKAGDNNTIQKFSTASASRNAFSFKAASDASIVDASYVRLKNLSLAWTLPKKWVKTAKFDHIKLFIHAQNLLTITNYEGLDPETGSITLPPLRVATIGINCSL